MPRQRDFAALNKALKGKVVVFYFESLIMQQMKAPDSPDVLGRSSKSEAQRVNLNETNSYIIHFIYLVFGFTFQILKIYCYIILSLLLVNFHARFMLFEAIDISDHQ